MKKIYKIIFLFAIIFIIGIVVTAIEVNSSLNKFETPEKTVNLQRDTTYLLQAEKKIG
jgi:uncharacterized protein YpmB